MTETCDLETGVCQPGPMPDASKPKAPVNADHEVIYVGDPMCSWCWGISPGIKQLQASCAEKHLGFSIVVGGLRPGGGDPWNDQFKAFLRHHWEEIGTRTGQPFSFDLLDRTHFGYDTEPSCRAVVVARQMLGAADQNSSNLYAFFAAIQEKFYVGNADPSEGVFYRELCEAAGLDFATFLNGFNSAEARTLTRDEFVLNRKWGVRGYPTVLFRDGNNLQQVATGFASGKQMIDFIDGYASA